MLSACRHCGAVEGTPHDRTCLTAEAGRTARSLLHRARGHLRRAEGFAVLGLWAKMRGAITDANQSEGEARDVSAEEEDDA